MEGGHKLKLKYTTKMQETSVSLQLMRSMCSVGVIKLIKLQCTEHGLHYIVKKLKD